MTVDLIIGEKKPGETQKAVIAFNDYLRAGPGRSIRALCDYYIDPSYHGKPPSKKYGTIKSWSSVNDWAERVGLWDAIQDERKTHERETELSDGLAKDYERVRSLKRLAALLEDQLYFVAADGTMPNLWLPDFKMIGYGEDSEVIETFHFNDKLIRQLRGTIDDLAKEVGGRIHQTSSVVKVSEESGPIEIVISGMDLGEI